MASSSHRYSHLSLGDVIAGQYRLESFLGEGGFGAVYRATQLALGREVALKLLHREALGSAQAVGRFRREAELAQGLEHPNTVRLFDFGQAEDGLPYIAWQLLAGRSLEQVILQEAPLTAERAARIASQVLKSLMEAHDKGIVHRDIKPANIFLSDFQGEPDFVTVLDFGVAKMVYPDAKTVVTLTLQGEIIGTPWYMSPEQVLGEQIGPQADLYSLGLVMAEMLTGRPVFDTKSAVAVCEAQASVQLAPIPQAALDSPLGAVIVTATSKPLEVRFASAAVMLAALEAAVDVSSGGWTARPAAVSGTGDTVRPGAAIASAARAADPEGGSAGDWVSGPSAQPSPEPADSGPPAPGGWVEMAEPSEIAMSATPAPRPRTGRSPLVIALVVCALVVAAAVGLAGTWLLSSRDGRPASQAEATPAPPAEPEPTVNPPPVPQPLPVPSKQGPPAPDPISAAEEPVLAPPAPPAAPAGGLEALTAALVRARLIADGWELRPVESSRDTDSRWVASTVSGVRGSTGVAVWIADCASPEAAVYTRRHAVAVQQAVAMQGTKVVTVAVWELGAPQRDQALQILERLRN